MRDGEFMPLRPRRHLASQAAFQGEPTEHAGEPGPAPTPSTTTPSALPPPSEPLPMTMAGQPAQSSAPAVELVVSEATSTDNDFTPRPPVALANADDAEEHAAAVRDEAIRFATIAAARALRTALAHDAAALTRYVDDALRACGRVVHSRVRLHPADAALYRPRRDVEIVADASAARGDVSVETDAGTVGATIEDRAALLVRAAAHA